MPRPCTLASLAAVSVTLLTAPPALASWSGDPAVNLSVADGGSDQAQPKLSPTPDGGVYVSWLDGIGTGWDVRIQKLDAAGNEVFPHLGELVADRSFSSTQDYGLSTEASGDAYLAFRDDRFTGTQISAARIGTSGATLWGPTGVQLTSTTDFVAAPGVAGTADGSCVVAWTQGSSTRVMKLDGLGVPVWASDVALTPASGSYSFNDIRAVGNEVIVSITHETGGIGSPRHLLAQKLAADGSLLWGAAPVVVFDGGSLQFGNFPDFVADGSGGGLFSWYDASTLQLQSYVQRILADGTEAYPHDGIPVSTDATRVRTAPSAAIDPGTGDITVFWVEQNTAQSQSGVYGQRIDSGGMRLWGESGAVIVPVGLDSVTQVRTVLLATGAFTFWSTAPGFGANVLLGARVDASGSTDVGPFDVASTPSGKSRLAAVALDGQAALSWGDDRVDGGDILAQNVNSDGSLGTGTIDTPEGPAAASEVRLPNPILASSVRIDIPGGGAGRLDVFDARGARVAALNVTADAEIRWDLTDAGGRRVAPGTYFYRLLRRGEAPRAGRFVVLSR